MGRRVVRRVPEPVMPPSPEQNAILTIALLAAFADGSGDDRERAAIRNIAESLAGEHGSPQLTQIYQDVLLKRVTLQHAVECRQKVSKVNARRQVRQIEARQGVR